MATILIGGGSGLIGTRISELLEQKGHKVLHLSRKKNLNAKFPKYEWDLKNEIIDDNAIAQADFVINLAGTGVVDQRWTTSRKKEIIDSRVKSTLLLKKAIARLKQTPKAIISASAIGFYGDRKNELMNEDSSRGKTGFLAESTREWEEAINSLNDLQIRQATIRIGIVLSSQGGALKPFLLQNQFRIGTYFGDGKQFYSWIHIDDLSKMFIHAIENEEIAGTYNGVAPNPIRLYKLVQSISKKVGKKALIIPVPSFLLRLVMGEMADVLLSSTKVSSSKIEQQGFRFEHPQLIPALKHIITNKR